MKTKKPKRPKTTFLVSISEPAFFTIALAALEAFCVPHGRSKKPVETYGNLWGHISLSKRDDETVIRVNQADVDTSAKRFTDSVQSEKKAYEIKHELIDEFFPEMKYLGDFHTHPWHSKHDSVNLGEIEDQSLMHFSDADYNHQKHLISIGRKYRLGLVLAVHDQQSGSAEKKREVETDLDCIRIHAGNHTIWIKAHVFSKSGKAIPADRVNLVCNAVGVHPQKVEMM